MIKVVPAVIPFNKSQLEEEISTVSAFADTVQVDISDGVFTRTKTWPYNGQDKEYFEKLKSEEVGWPKWEDVDVELHLMVEKPEEVLLDWVHTGISAVVCHIETISDFRKIKEICDKNEVSIGVAIKPGTDVERLEEVAGIANFIQVMGSNALGNHGVELDESAIEKIKILREKYPEKIIAIDIGVNMETKDILVEAGANKLISGSAILESQSPEEAYNELSF